MRAPCGGHEVGEVTANKTLTRYVGRSAHGHHLWAWTCNDCGIRHGPSTISHLRRSKRRNTCAQRPEHNGRWLGHEQPSGTFLYQYRSDAAKKGRVREVTAADLWGRWMEQGGRCACTGWALEHGVNVSIDRIGSTLGYVLGNVQWVHRDINRIKSDFSESYFRRLCAGVASFSRDDV